MNQLSIGGFLPKEWGLTLGYDEATTNVETWKGRGKIMGAHSSA